MAAEAYELSILERTIIIEFDSLEAAIAAHDGPDYQKVLSAFDDDITRLFAHP